ncbi:VanZ family protein [Corynebacterium pseudogenitalium]|uniref:VanZ family protein n=1 Tax=Corynebacterium pseudogenitalium TaxID=38303 RepID=UPI003AF09D5C
MALTAAAVLFFTIGKAYVGLPGVWEASSHEVRHLRLIPFGSFIYYRVWWGPWLNLIGNIVLFLPVGYLAGLRLGSVWKAALVSMVASLSIEAAQYALAAGYSDIDDLIINTAGGTLGATLAHMPSFTRTIFPDGNEPDARFTLANERTFLAWTRTALAFLAGGIALGAFDVTGIPPGTQTFAAATVIVIGMAIAAGAAIRWVRVERALRHGRPLPAPAIAPLLGVGILVASIVVLVGLLS